MKNIIPAFSIALKDIGTALSQWSLCISMAKEHFLKKNKVRMLGPIFLPVDYLFMVFIFTFIFRPRGDFDNYTAYIAIGLCIWFIIMHALSDSASLFSEYKPFILGSRLPIPFYVVCQLIDSLIRARYYILFCAIVIFVVGHPLSIHWLWGLVGAAVVIFSMVALMVIIAIASAFFAPLGALTPIVMRLCMFLTPVFWLPNPSGGVSHVLRALLADLNPFHHHLRIIREPLLNMSFPVSSLMICLAFSVLAWMVALFLLGTTRKKIAFLI